MIESMFERNLRSPGRFSNDTVRVVTTTRIYRSNHPVPLGTRPGNHPLIVLVGISLRASVVRVYLDHCGHWAAAVGQLSPSD